MEIKQVIIVRQDLQLPKGKLAAQVGHACVESYIKSDNKIRNIWRIQGQKKIVLKVPDEKTLKMLLVETQNQGIPHALITDAGKTVIAPGTITCLGIGPAEEDEIDKITGNLKML
jgi:peptidyl-tRNA hydrolase, PTH2 family